MPYSRWYFHIYLISTLILSALITGYSSMNAWLFNQNSNPVQYTVVFAVISSLSVLLILWTAYAFYRHFNYANPGEIQQRAYMIGSVCLNCALIIVSIVILGILTYIGSMSFYIVAIIWLAINTLLGVVSIYRSVIVVRSGRDVSVNPPKPEADAFNDYTN